MKTRRLGWTVRGGGWRGSLLVDSFSSRCQWMGLRRQLQAWLSWLSVTALRRQLHAALANSLNCIAVVVVVR